MTAIRWILLLAAFAAFILFAIPNWAPPVTLVFGATEVVTHLPLVVLMSVLLGFLPVYFVHRIARARWHTRLSRAELPATPHLAIAPTLHPCPPSLAQPTVVPTAGA